MAEIRSRDLAAQSRPHTRAWGAALADAVPDLISAAFISAMLSGSVEVDPARRELTFLLAYVDPGLQFACAILIALLLHLRAWPSWLLGVSAATTVAVGLGPLLWQIFDALPAQHVADAAIAGAWMLAARGFNAWRQFPDAREAFDDGRLFRALILPPLHSATALGLSIAIVVASITAHGTDPEHAPLDGLLMLAGHYFLLRGLLYAPPLQAWMRGRLERSV